MSAKTRTSDKSTPRKSEARARSPRATVKNLPVKKATRVKGGGQHFDPICPPIAGRR